jgi:uncharacterized phage protein gp47/JayE
VVAINFKILMSYKTFDALRQTAFEQLQSAGSQITNLNIGGVFRTLVELAMQGVSDLYSLLLSVIPMGYVQYATGQWLDLKVAEIGLTRKAAQKAEGIVLFQRSEAGSVIKIAADTIVKTALNANGEELRYFVTQDVYMTSDALTISVPVCAEFEGSQYNVGGEIITTLVTHISGIDSVTNSSSWLTTEGSDEEEDDALRERYTLRWNELATGSTAAAYESWAKSITGVTDVSVQDEFPRGPGTVDVVIAGTGGTPTEELLETVAAYIETKKPACSDVLVKAPTLKGADFKIVLYALTNTGDDATLLAEAKQMIQAIFTEDSSLEITPITIGESLYRAHLIALLMADELIVNVDIVTPAADITAESGELLTLGSIDISLERITG